MVVQEALASDESVAMESLAIESISFRASIPMESSFATAQSPDELLKTSEASRTQGGADSAEPSKTKSASWNQSSMDSSVSEYGAAQPGKASVDAPSAERRSVFAYIIVSVQSRPLEG